MTHMGGLLSITVLQEEGHNKRRYHLKTWLMQIWDTNVLAVACSFSLPVRVYALGMSHVAAAHCLVAVGGGEPQVQPFALCWALNAGAWQRCMAAISEQSICNPCMHHSR